MKEKKTIILVVVLIGLIGLYVWYANKTKPVAVEDKKADLAQRDPDQMLMRKLTKAIDTYKKENNSVSRYLPLRASRVRKGGIGSAIFRPRSRAMNSPTKMKRLQ